MPQERHNPFPFPIASEVEAMTGSRELKAARNVVARGHKGSIPGRGFLLGESDHAPVVKGVLALTTVCYRLLDAIPADQLNGTLGEEARTLREIMEDHGCPETRDEPQGVETLSNE